MAKKKASLELLEHLHGAIAEYYIEAAESGEDLSSGTLAAINAFLKNNGVTADIMEDSPKEDIVSHLRLLQAEELDEIAM